MNKIINNYRYERKFYITGLDVIKVEKIIDLTPGFFQEIHHKRFVNNVYFDSSNLQNYNDNIDGLSKRKKIRIRWYGDLFGEVKKPILEVKIKNNEIGKKLSYPLSKFTFRANLGVQEFLKIFANSELPEEIRHMLSFLRPTLVNRYSRKYFQSFDKKFRITLDDDILFYSSNNLYQSFSLNTIKNYNSLILELKYCSKCNNNASFITNFFPFRLTKSSKYVQGIILFKKLKCNL